MGSGGILPDCQTDPNQCAADKVQRKQERGRKGRGVAEDSMRILIVGSRGRNCWTCWWREGCGEDKVRSERA